MSTVLPAPRAASTTASHSVVGSLRRLLRASGLIWAFLLLCVVATAISPHFLQIANLVNVLRQIAMFGTISVGMTFVILTKGIDLSVGSLVGVVAVATALMLGAGVPIALAVVVATVLGGLLGAVNGLGITLGNVPPFIMTLGMMVMARGAAPAVSGRSMSLRWRRRPLRSLSTICPSFSSKSCSSCARLAAVRVVTSLSLDATVMVICRPLTPRWGTV